MRRILLLLAFISASVTAQPVFPPGSAIGLEPPPGFTLSQRFSGFEAAGSGSSIVLVEMPGAPHAELAQGFTPERVAQQGLMVTTRRTIALANGPAQIMEGTQRASGRTLTRWLVLLPDGPITGLVTVNLLATPADADTRATIERAVASLVVRRPDPAAQRAALPYVFEETPRLRFQTALVGNAALLAPEGWMPNARGTAPTLIIAQSLDRSVATVDRATAEAALRGLRNLRDITIDAETRSELAALSAIRLEVRANDAATNTPRRLVQWMAGLPGGGYLRVLAEGPADSFEAALPEFDQAVASLRLR